MNTFDKVVYNEANDYLSFCNSNVVSDIVRACQICGRSTNSVNDYICEECRNGILKFLQEDRAQ